MSLQASKQLGYKSLTSIIWCYVLASCIDYEKAFDPVLLNIRHLILKIAVLAAENGEF